MFGTVHVPQVELTEIVEYGGVFVVAIGSIAV